MKILISGFKPFLGQKINPSEKLALDLQNKFLEVVSIVLPVEFKQAFYILDREIQNVEPDYVIMLGQAADRKNICFEKIGLNWVQTTQPDESGSVPVMGPIEKTEPLALMTKFPVDDVFQYLKSKNEPVEISFSAGTYVCNDLYFRILNEFKTAKAVFVHVPLVKEQVDHNHKNYLDYETQLKVLTDLVHRLRGN